MSMRTSIQEIPLGISEEGNIVALSFRTLERNHCFITGFPCSGKSTLLETIIQSLVNNCNDAKVAVWTNVISEAFAAELAPSSIVRTIQRSPNLFENVNVFFALLNDEVERRMQIILRTEAKSYLEVDSLPFLVAIIDDFYLPASNESDRHTAIIINQIMRMSHIVGVTLICASQSPVSRISGLQFDRPTFGLFNIRIALKASAVTIFEALGLPPEYYSENDKAVIEKLSSGKVGDFIMINHYDCEPIQAGHFNDTITKQK